MSIFAESASTTTRDLLPLTVNVFGEMDMSSFNERVTELVNRYLRAAPGTTAVEKVNNAFRRLKHERETQCLNDPVTAAAEHYLFTRALSGYLPFVGAPWFVLSPLANFYYDQLKALAKSMGGDISLSDCPTSEGNCWIRMWAHLGVGEGFLDIGQTVPQSPRPSTAGMAFMCWKPWGDGGGEPE